MRVTTKVVDPAGDAYPAIVLFCVEGGWVGTEMVKKLDDILRGGMSDLAESGEFHGETGETALLHSRGDLPARRLLLVGLGREDELDPERWRFAAAVAARRINDIRLSGYAIALAPVNHPGSSLSVAAQAVVEGSLVGLQRLDTYRTGETSPRNRVNDLYLGTWSEEYSAQVEEGARWGRVVGEAVCWTRELVAHPANVMQPASLAEAAREIGRHPHVKVEVLDRDRMAELEMGFLLAVAQGSHAPPQFIIMEYNPPEVRGRPVVLVGKGITFDSGGLSLKNRENMVTMKADMAGAAAVLGTMRVLSELNHLARLVALIPATENLPGGGAYRPGDVIKGMSGKTVEVISTDAEGRLVLADALTYAHRYEPAAVIDVATLTGAIVAALGKETTAVMGTDPTLVAEIKRAGDISGERVWELPLWPIYRERLKSDIADLKNSGGRPAGAITAGLFLEEFARGYPWAHLDIAGTALREGKTSSRPSGPSGVGVRLLTQLLRSGERR